ncbi:hypothetical protein SAMN05443549_1211 [Flavobacterium fluvii]|uniref:Uncharacterized protein n=1 Tax=Flavobacterium fluvii TaxID=468056 RepID=A0A1M5Q3V0_9FLAO|nr:hypothetical protein SAMN05443549_1211 [Flavobacterium fluvii]
MVCTHKIKSKKEYGFLKQKKIWNGGYSFFCFKNPYPSRRQHSFKKTFFGLVSNGKTSVKKKIKKIKKKKAKVSSRFTKKQVQASGF